MEELNYFKSQEEKCEWLWQVGLFGMFGVYPLKEKRIGSFLFKFFTLNYIGLGWLIDFLKVVKTPVDPDREIKLAKKKLERKEKVMDFERRYKTFDSGDKVFAINKNTNKFFITYKTLVPNFNEKEFKEAEIDLKNLLKFKIITTSKTETNTITQAGKTKTSGVSMVGRGLVGYGLLGPVGLITGSATASKKHKKGKAESTSVIRNTHRLVLFIKGNQPVNFGFSNNDTEIENLMVQFTAFIEDAQK